MATRIGVDIGGTFTDLIFYDDQSGDVRVAKTPTTPHALEEGVLNAVRFSLGPAFARDARFFMHGTTVGLNALLQGAGAVTGLLCTEGFRDTLEIRRGDRGVMYDLFWKPPSPLVPRRRRLPVRERIRADGEILTPLEREDVTRAWTVFAEAQVEAIAVCFINAYVNPAHELLAEQVLREAGFTGDISLSHRLSREYREYERTSTTVIDAYIRSATTRYLRGVIDGLAETGFTGEVLVTRSGGGAITARELEARPFEAIQSGPVAGVAGAAELCRLRGWSLAITADVGGTSFDTSLVIDGMPQIKHEGEIVGWPLQTAWVDVTSIGAGGGSIAYADHGLLRVGPHSAGSHPGPACYGGGGMNPTVTDAALVLGMLGDGALSADMSLRADLAEQAIQPLASELDMSLDATAQGILAVATAAMADAIREITIGQGEDPRRAKLIIFGGAGPLFGTLLATELEIDEIIIPPYAGNFSAWGLLGQDVTQDTARTLIRAFDSDLLTELNSHLDEMLGELRQRYESSGPLERLVSLDLRYTGQEHTLSIRRPLERDLNDHDIQAISDTFAVEYERRFGTTLSVGLELVTLRATAQLALPRRAKERVVADKSMMVHRGDRIRGFSLTHGEWTDFSVLDRSDIEATARAVPGPVIVFESTATTYVDVGFEVAPGESNCLLIHRI